MVDDIEWTVINEGQLLDAMVGHKPVGVNKYFQMAFICDKFCDSLQKDINPQKIWDHLETMYNLEALDESESIPFPNSEKEFSLPESEFGSYLNKKDEDKPTHIESPKLSRKDDKPAPKNNSGRRDSTASNNSTSKTPGAKKEVKKEPEKNIKQPVKNRNSLPITKEEKSKIKPEEKPLSKRPTRGSLKPSDDSGSSGKSSPVNTITTKRRRI